MHGLKGKIMHEKHDEVAQNDEMTNLNLNNLLVQIDKRRPDFCDFYPK